MFIAEYCHCGYIFSIARAEVSLSELYMAKETKFLMGNKHQSVRIDFWELEPSIGGWY